MLNPVLADVTSRLTVGCSSLAFMLPVGFFVGTSARAVASAPVLSSSQDTSPASATTVRVFLSRGDNLQWMNFWVALGAGFFAQEGLEVELVVGGSARAFLHGRPMSPLCLDMTLHVDNRFAEQAVADER